MKTILKILLSTTLLLALTTSAAEKKDLQPLPKGKKFELYSFVRQPEERTAEIGTFVVFACRVYPETNAMYKWYFTTNSIQTEIPGATNREYFIDAATVAKVGSYKVEVTWPNSNVITSTNTFLSVYRRWGENPVSGTLTTTIDKFTSTATFNCASDTTITFDRVANLTDYFYGPFVTLSAQTGSFINDGRHYNVRFDSITTVNGSTPVGIRFLRGFGWPPYEVQCKSGLNVIGPIVDVTGLSVATDVTKARYTLSIYYRSPAPASGKIDINWRYY